MGKRIPAYDWSNSMQGFSTDTQFAPHARYVHVERANPDHYDINKDPIAGYPHSTYGYMYVCYQTMHRVITGFLILLRTYLCMQNCHIAVMHPVNFCYRMHGKRNR